MEIEVNWKGKGFQFEGKDDKGNTVSIDGNRESGSSPMSLLLHGAAACSAIDVVDILTKMRSEPEDLRVEVKAIRKEGKPPRPWTAIHLHFVLKGMLDPEKVQRAIDLSLEKYCSATANLRGVTAVTADFEIV